MSLTLASQEPIHQAEVGGKNNNSEVLHRFKRLFIIAVSPVSFHSHISRGGIRNKPLSLVSPPAETSHRVLAKRQEEPLSHVCSHKLKNTLSVVVFPWAFGNLGPHTCVCERKEDKQGSKRHVRFIASQRNWAGCRFQNRQQKLSFRVHTAIFIAYTF